MSMIDLLAWPASNAAAFDRCEGSQLVIQRFILELLTEQGSIKYRSDRGTTFLADLRSGRVHNETDLYAAFSMAESAIRPVLQDEETDDMEDSQKYRKATLVGVDLSVGSVQLHVKIESQASSQTVTIPVAA